MNWPSPLRSLGPSVSSLGAAGLAAAVVLVLGLMPPPNASSVLVLGLMPPPNASSVQDDPAAVVGMTNMLKYTPDTVRVQAGETVRWENSSLIMHTVTADPGEATLDGSVQLPDAAEPFDSGNLDPDETFEYTFETPGTYQYFCIPHEGAKMYGWVIVAP